MTQPLARTLMVQGTASNAGKSLLVAALCRIYARRGLRVAPFKAQNMSNNSAVTPDGFEIGRAQAVQAQAAGIAPRVDMNPILLKPEADARAQLVVRGRPDASLQATEYYARREALRQVVAQSLSTLRKEYDLVVIEGAGSPAEINLRQSDVVNMFVAHLVQAPVLLVGDIDRGGVFAALYGTLALLEPEDCDRVAGLVINKFRGDLSLLEPGLEMIATRAGKPVLGVVPFLPQLGIADEDSVALESRPNTKVGGARVDVAVVRYPRISNYDDVLPLERDPRVHVRFVQRAEDLAEPDLVVLPGSKSTLADLRWLRETGLAERIEARARRGGRILGVCGGYQMLGHEIDDPMHAESTEGHGHGLGLLPVRTCFSAEKTTADVRATAQASSFLTASVGEGESLTAYEIHMGQVQPLSGSVSPFHVTQRNGNACEVSEGAISENGAVVGTLLHGILDNASVRESLLDAIGAGSRDPSALDPTNDTTDSELTRLADAVEAALDMEAISRFAGLAP